MKTQSKSLCTIFLLIFIILYFNFSYSYIIPEFKIDSKNKLKSNDKDDIFGDIYVHHPSTTDILIIGTNFTIKWGYKGSIEFVAIALYKAYEFIDIITITTVNDGEYFWHVDDYEESNDYSIRIWDYNDNNNYDFSDLFLIATQLPRNSNKNIINFIIGLLISITILSISFIIVKMKRN